MILKKDNNNTPKAYIKGVNGLRSIFLVPVVVDHLILNFDKFNLDPKVFGDGIAERKLGIAVYGLGVFFGISGFLITYLLRLELKQRKSINIKRFYWRRALRILPLYYAQIIVSLGIYHVFNIEYGNWDLMIYYAFYMVNIPYVFGGVLPLLGHYWSLAVEEQFYIFWPIANKLNNSQLLKLCWFFLLLIIIVRSILMIWYSDAIILKLIDHPWFQCMLIGAIFALYYLDYKDAILKFAGNLYCQIACWIFLFGSLPLHRGLFPLDIELTTIASCLILIGQNSEKVFLNLEKRVLIYAGNISYSVYIGHVAVIFLCGELIPWEIVTNVPLRYFLAVFTVFTCTIIVAHIFYTLIEKPFLKIKEKRFTYVHGIKK